MDCRSFYFTAFIFSVRILSTKLILFPYSRVILILFLGTMAIDLEGEFTLTDVFRIVSYTRFYYIQVSFQKLFHLWKS
jgi:hypothetical protein